MRVEDALRPLFFSPHARGCSLAQTRSYQPAVQAVGKPVAVLVIRRMAGHKALAMDTVA